MQDNADSLGGVGGDRLDGLIDGLVQHGYAIAPGYLPLSLVRALREEAQHRDQQANPHHQYHGIQQQLRQLGVSQMLPDISLRACPAAQQHQYRHQHSGHQQQTRRTE